MYILYTSARRCCTAEPRIRAHEPCCKQAASARAHVLHPGLCSDSARQCFSLCCLVPPSSRAATSLHRSASAWRLLPWRPLAAHPRVLSPPRALAPHPQPVPIHHLCTFTVHGHTAWGETGTLPQCAAGTDTNAFPQRGTPRDARRRTTRHHASSRRWECWVATQSLTLAAPFPSIPRSCRAAETGIASLTPNPTDGARCTAACLGRTCRSAAVAKRGAPRLRPSPSPAAPPPDSVGTARTRRRRGRKGRRGGSRRVREATGRSP